MKIKFKAKYTPEGEYNLEARRYPNTRHALVLSTLDGEPQGVLTTNLPANPLNYAEIIIKDYSENEGTLQALIEADIVQPPHRHIASGHVTLPVCLLTEKGRAFVEQEEVNE